jgi:PAS domain S-box-containing protein
VNLKPAIPGNQEKNREAELTGNIEALREENIALKKETESCRQASEKLGVNYHYLSEAMDGMKDAALLVDSEGRITYLNKEAKTFFREAKGDLAGKQLVDVPIVRENEKFREKFDHALSDRSDARFLLLSRRNCHWYEVFLHPQGCDMLVYFRDVTLQHTTEELYKLTHFSINHILDAAIWIRPNGYFIYVNETACRSLGYPRDELIRKTFASLVTYLPLNGWDHFWERVKNNGSMTFESDIRNSAGGTYPAEISVNYIKFHDNECMVALIRDISERKRAERELMASKAQADASREQAELYLDLMGHDITNINQIGMGYLELALDTIDLSEEQRELLIKPLQSLQNGSRLIDNVRKLQRLNDGKIPDRVIDIGGILEDISRQYVNMANRQVVINITRTYGCNVLANDLLQDVFDNIISNSVRHNEGDLSIDITIEKTCEGNRDYCTVAISDNGRGIPDEQKRKIFDRAKNIDYLIGGSGLGLYLVRTVVERYDGKIRVEDRVPGDYSQGAKFVVMIPSVE